MIYEIGEILTDYPITTRANLNPNGQLPVCMAIKNLSNQIEQILTIPQSESLVVERSWGKGSWTPTPWVAILDTKYTTTTQAWFYPVLLFRADG